MTKMSYDRPGIVRRFKISVQFSRIDSTCAVSILDTASPVEYSILFHKGQAVSIRGRCKRCPPRLYAEGRVNPMQRILNSQFLLPNYIGGISLHRNLKNSYARNLRNVFIKNNNNDKIVRKGCPKSRYNRNQKSLGNFTTFVNFYFK